MDGWESLPGEFPWPPANGQVFSPLFVGAVDIRWDDPSTLATGVVPNLVQATGEVIVLQVPQASERASGTVTITGGLSDGEALYIAGIALTAVEGARTPGADNFDVSLPTTQDVAQDLANAINDAANSIQGLVTASVSGSVVTLTPAVDGSAGNDIHLRSTNRRISLSGDTLEGGVDADYIVIGGVVYLVAVAGPRTPGQNDFSVDGDTFAIADSIAAALNDPLNHFTTLVRATSLYGRVSLTAVPPGYVGNQVGLGVSSNQVFDASNTFLTGGEGDVNCKGRSNATWNIVGVNVYRSDNGERGPYIRLNRFPIGSMAYRDSTDNLYIENEVVQWDGAWVSKGDEANNRAWVFRTIFCPVVKPNPQAVPGLADRLQAIYANSPSDVQLTVGGVNVPVDSVYGPNGEITLVNQAQYNVVTEKFEGPYLPSADVPVLVSYYYNSNLVQTSLDRTTQVRYRLTTVALDPSSPTGYAETPLGYSPPLALSSVETMDYIWREAIRRNRWILEQGGERVKLFKKKVSGHPCPCRIDEKTLEWQQQPSARCLTCLGTGFVGAYDGPIDIIIAPDEADRAVTQTPYGRRLEHNYEVWTEPSPAITQRDFLVKQTGERYSIGPVRRPASRGLPLQQHFTIAYLDEQDICYRMPVTGLEDLPWPETRPTDPNTPCHDADPYPIGFDYQATPMETEKGNIPEGRQERGRTPVWSNIQW